MWQKLCFSLVKNGERRDTGRQTKQERFMENEYPPKGNSLNRGFYMKLYLREFYVLSARVFTVGTEKKFDYYRHT